MLIDSPSRQYTNTSEYSNGEVVVATVWLVFFLLLVGTTITSEALSSAIAFAALF